MGLETNKVKYKKSWQLVRLAELCDRISDGTHFTPEYITSGVPFISVKDIYEESVHFDKCKYISVEAHHELIKRCFPEKDDILITKSGTIGRMALVPKQPEFSLFVSVALLKNKKELIYSKFLKYCLENFLYHINISQDIKGGLLKNFHLEDIRETVIPKVALQEQQLIISKIEELLSDLENGKQQLQIAQQQLKVYRQSLLKWAFKGWLTTSNVNGELPPDWKWIKVSEISDVVRGGSPRPAGDPKFYDGNIPFLKVRDITKDNGVYLTTFEYTIKEAGLHKTRQIKPNTLLLSNSGATLGVPKICMIDATMNDGIAAFLNLDNRSNLYLYYFWLSKTKELRNINMGAAQPNLNTDIIKNYLIPWCSFEEQKRIVDELDSKLTVCDKIEETICQSLQKAETLRQSILKKAFEGKLV